MSLMHRKTLRSMHSKGESCKLGCGVRPWGSGLQKCMHSITLAHGPELPEAEGASQFMSGPSDTNAQSSWYILNSL